MDDSFFGASDVVAGLASALGGETFSSVMRGSLPTD